MRKKYKVIKREIKGGGMVLESDKPFDWFVYQLKYAYAELIDLTVDNLYFFYYSLAWPF